MSSLTMLGSQIFRGKAYKIALRAFALIFAFVAVESSLFGETRPPYQGNITGSLLGEPARADPLFALSHSEVTFASLVFDRLYVLDANGDAVPHLASSLPARLGATTLAVPILSGVRFHSGHILSEVDVVFSLKRAMAKGWGTSLITNIELSDGKIIFESSLEPKQLAQVLCLHQFSVVREGAQPGFDNIDGTGAFRVVRSRKKRREIRFRRFENHFAGPPYLESMRLRWYTGTDSEARAYQSGRAQFSQAGDVAFAGHRAKYRTQVAEGPATILKFVGFGKNLADNLEFKRQFVVALGKNSFVNVGSGEQVLAPAAPFSIPLSSDNASSNYKSLSSTAPETNRKSLDVVFDITRPGDRAVAEKIVAAVFQLGWNAKIVALPTESFAERIGRQSASLFIGELVLPPSISLQNELLRKLTGGTLAASPFELGAEQAQSLLLSRMHFIPLFRRSVRVHYQSNLRGLRFGPFGNLNLGDLFVFGGAQRNPS